MSSPISKWIVKLTASQSNSNVIYTVMPSVLDAGLILAYKEINFIVNSTQNLTLNIGQFNPHLKALLGIRNGASCAFVTAANPLSENLTDPENELLQRNLATDLDHRRISFLSGVGQHPSGNWPGEPSYLAINLSLKEAEGLGRTYKQNAVVWIGSDAIPKLVLLR